VLSGRGLCDGPITRQEESYRLWCVVVCDMKTSLAMGLRPTGAFERREKSLKTDLNVQLGSLEK
jgi:hypothetical protein